MTRCTPTTMLAFASAFFFFVDGLPTTVRSSHAAAKNALQKSAFVAGGDASRRCTISPSSNCSLASMQTDASTLVFPGGSTRCIFSNSGAYSFQVIRGDPRRVLVYFEGGGSCWDRSSTDFPLCATSAYPAPLNGIFDRHNAENPYRSYTVVHVLYCSGDAHAGNVTRPYNDWHGHPVEQRGYHNTRSALTWLHQNVGHLDVLAVSGCSAGSIGAQTWAGAIFREFEATRRVFLADSFAGVFPTDSQGVTIKGYGMCDLDDLIPQSLKERCANENITLQDYVSHTMRSNPSVNFAFINSKTDLTQRTYFSAIAASFHDDPFMSAEQYYRDLNDIFVEYATQHTNFITFMVQETQHCYTNSRLMYSADASGKYGNGGKGREKLVEWMQHFPLQKGDSVSAQCSGNLVGHGAGSGSTYCDLSLNRTLHGQ